MRADRKRLFIDGTSWSSLMVIFFVSVTFFISGCGDPSISTTPVAEPSAEEGPNPEQPEGPPSEAVATALLGHGQRLYARHCAACHGERGDGNGVAATFLLPKPRDFRAGRFRLVSTQNNVPSKQDLHDVLARGMPGSSMPPWGHLSQDDREALVEEVMRLRGEGARDTIVGILRDDDELTDEELAEEETQEEIEEFVTRFITPGESTVVPEIQDPTAEAITRGHEVYVQGGCVQCHGKDGKGDGVEVMLDAEQMPSTARDFTLGIFKGGHDPASLYRRLAYGMPGTPMPGSKNITPEKMVDLIHFILSLSTEEQRQAVILNRETILARKVDAIAVASDASVWSEGASIGVRMTPLWWRNNADTDLQVQAVHDGKILAVRISWRDESHDLHAARSESFEDAVAMELYRGESEPFLGMGDRDSPIDLWFWDADRQGEPLAVEQLYPNSVVDRYPFSEVVVATAELSRDGARTADQPIISLPALASGNPIVPTSGLSGASSLLADGPGSVSFRIPKSQLVGAHGQWRDGRWTVVMTRLLAVSSADDGVALSPGGRASVAFAVWNGSQQDRDGKKLISIWQDLELEP